MRSGSSASASAAERSTFRLTASLGTLQVRLNYEGAGCATLSQVSTGKGCLLSGYGLRQHCCMRAQHTQRSTADTTGSIAPCILAQRCSEWASRMMPTEIDATTSHSFFSLQASVDAFTFGLDVKPDSSMVIRSTLGNVRVSYTGECPGEFHWGMSG